MNRPNAANVLALAKYTKINVQTGVEDASPHRLIQMLLDGALTRIATAKGCIKLNQIKKKGENIGSAISILGGLRDSLDHDVGGEMAANLDNLYEYMSHQLMFTNHSNDEAALDEVHGLLMELKTAWDEIGNSPEAKSMATNEQHDTSIQEQKVG